ncbi:MAG: OmpH family outer membrane protein [Pseudomonadota bacterium]
MRKLIASFILALASALIALPATAQQAPPAAVVIVDFSRVVRESLAGKDANSQVSSAQYKLSAREQELKDKLQKMQENLVKQRELMTEKDEPAFQKLVGDYQREAKQAEAELQQKAQGIRTGQMQANTELENALRPLVRQIMTERKANLVLDKNSGVFDHADGLDVTTQVIERLNQRLPSLKVALPE